MSPGNIASIVIILLLVAAALGYVVYTILRARRLGLPPPTWRNFVPFVSNKRSNATAFEPTRPSGGVLGRVKGVFSGNSAGYDGSQTRSSRTRHQADAVWSDRIEEEEEELGYRGPGGAAAAGAHNSRSNSRVRDYGQVPSAYAPREGETPYPSGGPGANDTGMPKTPGARNPFEEDVRREDVRRDGAAAARESLESHEHERRSVFREG